VNLLDMGVEWTAVPNTDTFEAKDRANGSVTWTGTRVDLVFGSNSVLRALSEVYASEADTFITTFVAAWAKVMNADRF
jgi:catalase-peroxidase